MAKRSRLRTDGSPRLERPRIQGKRSEVYYVVWSEKGRSKRQSTGTADEVEARNYLTRFNARRARPKDAKTVNDCIDHYLQVKRETGAKTVTQIECVLSLPRERFGALSPSEITPAYQRKYSADRLSGKLTKPGRGKVGPRSVAMELAYLRAALNLAVDEEIIAKAPKFKLPKNAGIRRRKRFLTAEETAKLLAAVRDERTLPHIKLFVTLALLTAQRGIAIRELQWEHVDFDAGVIWFSRTDPDPAANKNRQDVPMTATLRRLLLAARQAARTPYVIEYRDNCLAAAKGKPEPRPLKSVKKGVKALFARAGLENVNVHDLRRTTATAGLAKGQSLEGMAYLLGDDPEVVRAHYAHVAPALLLATMEAVDPFADEDDSDE